MKDAYAKSVLENQEMFFHLLDCVTMAGHDATRKNVVKEAANDICVLPAGVPNLTRRVIPLALNVRQHLPGIPTVHYDPRSITIIGGAAVQAYDATMPTDEYYQQTGDIDAVWWPKITLPRDFKTQLAASSTEYANPETEKYSYIYQTANNSEKAEEGPRIPYMYAYRYGTRNAATYVNTSTKNILRDATNFAVLSSSRAIQVLCGQYVAELQKYLNEFIVKHDGTLRAIALEKYGKKLDRLEARVRMSNLFIAGVCNVWGYLILGDNEGHEYTIKLIEVAIHDGASSQKSNTIEPAASDFIFSRYQEIGALTKPELIQYQVKDGAVYQAFLPIQQRLLDQQLKALEGRVGSNEKVTTHIMRSKFLHLMIRRDNPDMAEHYKGIFIALCEKHKELEKLCWRPVKPPITPTIPTSLPPLIPPAAQHPSYARAPHAPHAQHPSYARALHTPHTPHTPHSPRVTHNIPQQYHATTHAANRTPHRAPQQTRTGVPPPSYKWVFVGTTGAGEEIFDLIDEYSGHVLSRNFRAPAPQGKAATTYRRGREGKSKRTRRSQNRRE